MVQEPSPKRRALFLVTLPKAGHYSVAVPKMPWDVTGLTDLIKALRRAGNLPYEHPLVCPFLKSS